MSVGLAKSWTIRQCFNNALRNAYFFWHMRARASAATKPSGSAHYKGRMGCVPIWKTQARLPLQRSQVNQHTANVEWDTASIESRLKGT